MNNKGYDILIVGGGVIGSSIAYHVKEIYKFLIKIVKEGTTILLVDQNIRKALEVSSYLYLLEMGQVKKEGPKEDFEESIREIIKESLFTR